MRKFTANRIDTAHYQFAHGRLPRGRGNWHFDVEFSHGDDERFIINTGWRDAKRAVVAFCNAHRDRRPVGVVVCS